MKKIVRDIEDGFDISTINKKSIRGGGITVGSKCLTFFVQIISTAILARILSPKDYGLIAMVVSITGFAGIFTNLGLSTATIQREKITHNQISGLFWINFSLGVITTLFIAGTAPLIAWFYKEPLLVQVVMALSVNFVINGLAVQHFAILNRLMRFSAISFIEILSMVLGISIAILAAKNGFGYWSLVLNSIIFSLIKSICAWSVTGWVPSIPKRGSGIRSMLKLGSDVTGFNVFNYFSRNLDNVLIGRFHGGAELGIYSKAYQLLMLPITNLGEPMMSVALPAMSRLQSDPDAYRRYYLNFVALLSFLSMPTVTFMFVCADILVLLVLGAQWVGAGEIFKLLAIAAFIQPIAGTVGIVMLSYGRSRLYLKIGIFTSFVFSLSFIIGVPFGVKGVAVSYAIANYILFFPTIYFTFKGSCINVYIFFKELYKPFLSSMIMGFFCFYFIDYFNYLNVGLLLLFSFVFSSIVYLLIYNLFRSGRSNFYRAFKFFCSPLKCGSL